MFRKKNKIARCTYSGKPITECNCGYCEQSCEVVDEWDKEIHEIAEEIAELLPESKIIVASPRQLAEALHEAEIRTLPGMAETDLLLPYDIPLWRN